MSALPDALLSTAAGETLLLLGNEAIVRGAIEARVRLVSGYPGTPASEIGDAFSRLKSLASDILFEWSVNEKVALEAAFAAAMVGARSLCFMKHLGLSYAGDPLATIPYIGVSGGMVIVSASDPGMVVSPNEQDQRHLARMNHLPVLEPSTPEEARAMTRLAFALSEACKLPVLLRTTPAVAHTRGVVSIEEPEPEHLRSQPAFQRRPAELNPIPVNARRMLLEIDQRLERAAELLASSQLFARTGQGSLGVLAGGPPLALVLDQVEELGLGDLVTVQAAGATYPMPGSVLDSLIHDVDRLLVVEELTPFLEDMVRARAYEIRPQLQVLGKRTGHLPEHFAYTPDLVAGALAHSTDRPGRDLQVQQPPELPPRPPSLCPGCPHRAAYLAVRTVFGDDTIYYNDIGCYTLGYGPPLASSDTLLAMGSSIAMAAAASRVLGTRTVAFVGDSTFFHSGMPPLLDAVETGAEVVVVVLDNRITAMTGHQPSPTTPGPGSAERPSPEAVAGSLGVGNLHIVDPHDLKATLSAFQQARQESGVSLVVTRRDCAIVRFRERGATPQRRRFRVDLTRCRHCGHGDRDQHCGQGSLPEHERAMVRRRILDQREGAEPMSVAVQADAPCSLACPADICVPGYIGRLAGGRYREGLALVRRYNPLAAVSSRVCHRPCEEVCTRRTGDRPIAINDLKRFLVDWQMAQRQPAPPLAMAEPTGKAVAVIGAGPSGLACALELRLLGHQVALLDEHEAAGGLLVQAIPAHRLPRSVLSWETDWIIGHGIELRPGTRLGREVRVSDLLEQGFDAVYLGVGAMVPEPLGVPGDDLPGAAGALELLRHHHRGGELGAAGRRCIVVGGGDAAIDVARILLRLGAAAVQVVYRRSREEMPAHREEIDAAEEEGIEISPHLAPLHLLGDSHVEGLRVIATEPGEPDSGGRRRPVPVPGSERDLAADMVVSAIGQRPDLRCLDGDITPALTAEGLLQVDPDSGATSVPGVFAGGDCTPGPRTVVHAVADGRRAAHGIDRFLGGSLPLLARVEAGEQDRYQPRNLVPEPGHRTELRPADERSRDHLDVVVPLSEEQAREEAARCLLCSTCGSCSACADLLGCPALHELDGCMMIDEALCSGCGVCVGFCPNGAIVEVP